MAKGADGGEGLHKHPGGQGSLVRAVFYFHEGDNIFLVIGQAGDSVCSMKTQLFDQCKANNLDSNSKKLSIGGGGGGATYGINWNFFFY